MSASEQRARACAESMLARDHACQHLGIRLLSVSPARAEMTMTVSEQMIQGHGTCHGGYIFTLADSAFAIACNTYDQVTVGMACTIDYIAPARLGDTLLADARELARSGHTGTYDVRVSNQNGELIALFRGKSYSVRGSVIAPGESK